MSSCDCELRTCGPSLWEPCDVTIRIDKSKSDFKALKRILDEMSDFKTTAKSEDEAIRQWKDEFRRRLVAAGLSK